MKKLLKMLIIIAIISLVVFSIIIFHYTIIATSEFIHNPIAPFDLNPDIFYRPIKVKLDSPNPRNGDPFALILYTDVDNCSELALDIKSYDNTIFDKRSGFSPVKSGNIPLKGHGPHVTFIAQQSGEGVFNYVGTIITAPLLPDGTLDLKNEETNTNLTEPINDNIEENIKIDEQISNENNLNLEANKSKQKNIDLLLLSLAGIIIPIIIVILLYISKNRNLKKSKENGNILNDTDINDKLKETEDVIEELDTTKELDDKN